MYLEEQASINTIKKKYRCGQNTLYNLFEENNIETRGRKLGIGGSNRRHNKDLQENFFDLIDTEEKAYLLGFLFADGNVCSSGQISIEIHERDIEILYRIKELLKIDSEITKRRDTMVTLKFYSQRMVKILSKYGIVPDKTHKTEHLPNISESFKRHFLRGLFDGDGWFTNRDNGKYYTMGFVTYHKSVCQEFQEMCNSLIITKNTANLTKKSKESHAFVSQFQKQQCVRELAIALYKDSNIYLSRKYNIAKEIIKTNDNDIV